MKETAYLFQAALICAWWAGLSFSPAFFDAFQFDGFPRLAFWSFFAPDILVIGSLSAIRAYRSSVALEYAVLGAFAYATLYCLNAAVLSASGILPALMMSLGLAYNMFLCFTPVFFRTSTSSRMLNAAKTVVQVVCIWLITLCVIPYVILHAFNALDVPQPGARAYAACGLFACFSALGLASSFVMVRDGAGTPLPLDQTNTLVVAGPYRFVRNPMALAGIGQGLSIALLFQSVPLFLYALLGAAVWQVVIRPAEERDLERRFGGAYLDYRRQVTCWLPVFRRGNKY
jgi:protein-S-isoprenylcysteine O-methyltransferase Ste14